MLYFIYFTPCVVLALVISCFRFILKVVKILSFIPFWKKGSTFSWLDSFFSKHSGFWWWDINPTSCNFLLLNHLIILNMDFDFIGFKKIFPEYCFISDTLREHLNIYVCVHAYMYVCVSVWIYIYIHTFTGCILCLIFMPLKTRQLWQINNLSLQLKKKMWKLLHSGQSYVWSVDCFDLSWGFFLPHTRPNFIIR